jgi:acetyl esterase/lipase
MINRRRWLGMTALAATLIGTMGRDAQAESGADFPLTGPDPAEILPLWPTSPPGGPVPGLVEQVEDRAKPGGLKDRAALHITQPTLSVFRPAKPNGSALLLIPGGGYARVVMDKEGFETARLLAAEGITVFVLLYRLPGDGWAGGPDTPMQDAQRALRLIRHQAPAYGVAPGRIGVMGFSAGGHLSASLATRYDEKLYDPVDAADAVSARPDHACLVYPVITLAPPSAHTGSAHNMLGHNPAPDRVARYSPQNGVTAQTPPSFLLHALDDKGVSAENSLLMLAALQRAGVPAEAHFFQEGGHGFGLRGAVGKPVAAWPSLYLAWARRNGFIPA